MKIFALSRASLAHTQRHPSCFSAIDLHILHFASYRLLIHEGLNAQLLPCSRQHHVRRACH